MKMIFLGPPGTGKGTIAGMVEKKYGFKQISTGDILREEIKQGSDLGKKAKEIIDQGHLVPDELMIDIIKNRLQADDCKNGFILDGFPRTLPQAEALSKIVGIDKVIELNCDKELILMRLGGRWTCRNCGAIFHEKTMPPKVEGVCDGCGGELYQRDDQKPEAITERLVVYDKQTKPLIDYYKEKGLLAFVDTSPPPEVIFEHVCEIIYNVE
jgi:adenylate kinase